MTDELKLDTEVRSSEGRQIAVVSAEGDIDLATAAAFTSELGADDCRSSDGIVIDLTEVPFMDSNGLRAVLVSIEQLACPIAVVVGPGSALDRLIDITGVSARLPSYPSADAAVAGLSQDHQGPKDAGG